MTAHALRLGVAGSLRPGSPCAQPATARTSDTRGVRASALRCACAGLHVADVVAAFELDPENETHVRKVKRWLADGAPPDAIAMLPAAMRDAYYAARWATEGRAA